MAEEKSQQQNQEEDHLGSQLFALISTAQTDLETVRSRSQFNVARSAELKRALALLGKARLSKNEFDEEDVSRSARLKSLVDLLDKTTQSKDKVDIMPKIAELKEAVDSFYEEIQSRNKSDTDSDLDHDGERENVALSAELKSAIALLFKGVNCNYVDPMTGDTPLHMAAKKLNLAYLMLLTKVGVEAWVVNKAGYTALDEALNVITERSSERDIEDYRVTDDLSRDAKNVECFMAFLFSYTSPEKVLERVVETLNKIRGVDRLRSYAHVLMDWFSSVLQKAVETDNVDLLRIWINGLHKMDKIVFIVNGLNLDSALIEAEKRNHLQIIELLQDALRSYAFTQGEAEALVQQQYDLTKGEAEDLLRWQPNDAIRAIPFFRQRRGNFVLSSDNENLPAFIEFEKSKLPSLQQQPTNSTRAMHFFTQRRESSALTSDLTSDYGTDSDSDSSVYGGLYDTGVNSDFEADDNNAVQSRQRSFP